MGSITVIGVVKSVEFNKYQMKDGQPDAWAVLDVEVDDAKYEIEARFTKDSIIDVMREYVDTGDLLSVTGYLTVRTWEGPVGMRQQMFVHGDSFTFMHVGSTKNNMRVS